MNSPIICFGQQPNGFFPKRFLVAKINTARRLQKELGGPDASVGGAKIIFFYHDSDADYRETITVMRDRQTGAEARLNFLQPNKTQKKFSPLYAKKIASGWKQKTLKQLPRFVDRTMINLFASIDETLSVADFCLEMYKKMGLLERIDVISSGDKNFRESALDLDKDLPSSTFQDKIRPASKNNRIDKTSGKNSESQKVGQGYFADVEYQGEIVRAEMADGKLRLHEGGGKYLSLPDQSIAKWQKSAGRDSRFAWMQSAVHCTHYITGLSEDEYLDKNQFPEITFVERKKIESPNLAWLG